VKEYKLIPAGILWESMESKKIIKKNLIMNSK
jgi:hypothetical protein